MKGVLCIGGTHPPVDQAVKIMSGADIIAAADSGFDFIWKNELRFDYVIGDMDSTRHPEIIDTLPEGMVIALPDDKDETDTEAGLLFLKKLGAEQIIIVGGGGGRLDHLLGIVTLFNREIRPDEWYTDYDTIISIDKKRIFRNMKGKTVSFFPAGADVCRLRSSGLKWKLDALQWRQGDAGISNIVTSRTMTVEPVSGRAICIFSQT